MCILCVYTYIVYIYILLICVNVYTDKIWVNNEGLHCARTKARPTPVDGLYYNNISPLMDDIESGSYLRWSTVVAIIMYTYLSVLYMNTNVSNTQTII
jgi:hypothetical protein